MIEASAAWKDIQQRFLTTEGHIEITCAITETGVQERATASGTNEAIISDVNKILGADEDSTNQRYATNELNFWALDGSRTILPDYEPYKSSGYVSDISESGSVTLTLPEVHDVPIPGVTITWSSEYGEYPPVFTVTAKNGGEAVAELTVTDNKDKTCLVDLEITNYDSITITVHNWCVPYRRARIERVDIGHTLTLTKKDIISYSHEQHGDLLTGEIPKNSIEFSLNNSDGRWNPNNPTGREKYLAERQKLTVRYGMNVNGSIEWIKAGTFYLSEWHTPSNGLEARFVARDIFDYLLGANVEGASVYGNLAHFVRWATSPLLPVGAEVEIDASLDSSPGRSPEITGTAAEVVQRSANAACCVLRYDRDGILHVEPLNKAYSGYHIPLALSYSYPEINLSKPLKEVSIDYGGESAFELAVSSTGEKQTVTNKYIYDEEYAANVAEWVRDVLKSRKTVSGEFRADPRLDLFDVVTVEDKYGQYLNVAITNIKYTFNGAFRGSYVGRVIDPMGDVLGSTFVLGKSILGTVG